MNPILKPAAHLKRRSGGNALLEWMLVLLPTIALITDDSTGYRTAGP